MILIVIYEVFIVYQTIKEASPVTFGKKKKLNHDNSCEYSFRNFNF